MERVDSRVLGRVLEEKQVDDDGSDPAVRVLHLFIVPQISHQKCLPECQQRAEEGCKTHTLLETGLSAQHPQVCTQLCMRGRDYFGREGESTMYMMNACTYVYT